MIVQYVEPLIFLTFFFIIKNYTIKKIVQHNGMLNIKITKLYIHC